MAKSRRPLLYLALAGVAVVIAVPVTVRSVAQREAPNPPAVRVLDVAVARTTGGTDRGATYHWLEAQATKVTTRFSDAIATTERLPDGDSKTVVTNPLGNEVATFRVNRTDSVNHLLEVRTSNADPLVIAGRPDLPPTLDWSNRQAYGLWKDLSARPNAVLEWQNDLVRSAGARKPVGDALEIRTDWPDGLSATVVRAVGVRRHALTGAQAYGHTFRSRLTKNAQEVGSIRWDVEEQVLSWSFPDLTEGYVDPSRLATIGGWTFIPDMAWLNIQSFAFHHFHSLVQRQGFVARRQEGWIPRVIGFFAPTMSANEPGCDYLHWLDNSVLRPCCDVHDGCYQKNGCDASSWWRWWNSWTCDVCNFIVGYCFASGGKPPYHQSP